MVTVPQPTGRPSAVITVPKDLGELPGSAGESASSHGGGFLRAVGNSGNSVMRGAVSNGYQQIAEGFYNMLGSMLGRNPHSNTPTPDLRIHLRIAEQKHAVEQAAMDARRKREPRSRGFAPPPDYGKLKDQPCG